MRLLGGVAVWARCPSARRPELAREYGDVDIVTPGRSAREVGRFLESLGYEPDKLFNALHGAQRMNFMDAGHDRPLDVLVDRFVMCHALDLRDRLAVEELTIPLADLLLTKLQVVKINEKDLLDLLALLADHAPDHGGDAIDLRRVVRGAVRGLGVRAHGAGQPGAPARLRRGAGGSRDGRAGPGPHRRDRGRARGRPEDPRVEDPLTAWVSGCAGTNCPRTSATSSASLKVGAHTREGGCTL